MLTPNSKVGDILTKYPSTEKVFTDLGFTELKNPVMRATVAKYASLQMAADRKKMDVQTLIDALEIVITQEDA